MRRAPVLGVVAMSILMTGIVSPAAMAGQASVDTTCSPGPDGMGSQECDSKLTYTAASGETNDVAVTIPFLAGDAATLRDAGASVTAGAGCARADAHSVRCPGATSGNIQLGDGDDRAAGSGEVSISGAGGSDRLVGAETGTLPGATLSGGSGNDELTGGGGPDTLDGGAGRDVLRGEAGDDRLDGDGTELAADTDTIEGGPGTDTVSYTARHRRVSVDLAAGRASGSGSENDALTGIEDVNGGFGPSVLRGNAGPNRLVAHFRGSTIDGRGGDDVLVGTEQRDRLSGGDGDDDLRGLGGGDILSGGRGSDGLYPQIGARPLTGVGADKIDCGPGSDVTVPYRSVLVPRSCEAVALPGYALVRGRLRGNRRLAVRVDRIRPEEGSACLGRFSLRGPDRRVRGPRRAGALLGVGRARFPRAEGASRTTSVRLTARGRRAAQRSGPLHAVLGLRITARCVKRSRSKSYAYRVSL